MDEQVPQVKDLGQSNKYFNPKIIVIGVIIVCVIAALVYFKVLPLTPSAPVAQPEDKTAVVPTPTAFPYDVAKAEKLLTDYLKETLKPELLPSKIEIKQGQTIDGNLISVEKLFGASIIAPDATIAATFHYKEGLNVHNDYFIFIDSKKATQVTATASLANTLLSSYFANPYPISNCQSEGITSYCENFQTLNDGKKGYGIMFIDSEPKTTHIIFTCFIPKESDGYSDTASCITLP